MSQTKKYIKRSILDRRTNKDRRTLNLGPLFPGKEQRITRNRRQRFEDRLGWQQLTRLRAVKSGNTPADLRIAAGHTGEGSLTPSRSASSPMPEARGS
jgi:hypothetical protein